MMTLDQFVAEVKRRPFSQRKAIFANLQHIVSEPVHGTVSYPDVFLVATMHDYDRALAQVERSSAPTEPTEDPLEARVLKLESDLDWLKGHVRGADDSLGNRLDAADRDLNALSERIETHTHPLDIGTLHRTKTLAPYPVEQPAQPADAETAWMAVGEAMRREWKDGAGPGSPQTRAAKAAVAKAVELGLVPRREVVVTNEDIYAAIESFDGAPGTGFDSGIRAALESFADRLNGSDR